MSSNLNSLEQSLQENWDYYFANDASYKIINQDGLYIDAISVFGRDHYFIQFVWRRLNFYQILIIRNLFEKKWYSSGKYASITELDCFKKERTLTSIVVNRIFSNQKIKREKYFGLFTEVKYQKYKTVEGKKHILLL